MGIRPRSAQSRRGGASMEYYSWRDLAVGRAVVVFGREMLLTDADEFTREWYKEHAGALDADFAPVPVWRLVLPCICLCAEAQRVGAHCARHRAALR